MTFEPPPTSDEPPVGAPPSPVEPATDQAPKPVATTNRAGVLLAAVALIAVLAGTALFFAGFSLGRQVALTPGTPSGDAEAFQPFWDTYAAIIDRYAGGDVDRRSLVEGAIKGMIGALDDPYSQYMTSDEFKASLQGISGQFEGIGATIGTVDGTGAVAACTTLDADLPAGRGRAAERLTGGEGWAPGG